MKTAIYVPDDIFKLAEIIAKNLQLSRSELYSRAIKEYISNIYSENVIRQLDAVYEENNEDSKIDGKIFKAQLDILEKEEW